MGVVLFRGNFLDLSVVVTLIFRSIFISFPDYLLADLYILVLVSDSSSTASRSCCAFLNSFLLWLDFLQAFNDRSNVFLDVFQAILAINAHFSGKFTGISVKFINVSNLLDCLVLLPLIVRDGS